MADLVYNAKISTQRKEAVQQGKFEFWKKPSAHHANFRAEKKHTFYAQIANRALGRIKRTAQRKAEITMAQREEMYKEMKSIYKPI